MREITNIDKDDFWGTKEKESFADSFDRAFRDDPDPALEKIFEPDFPDDAGELGNDAYKDVLSSLSQLDKTGDMNIDYLEMNRTRTLRIHEIQELEAIKNAEKAEKKDDHEHHHSSGGAFKRLFGKLR